MSDSTQGLCRGLVRERNQIFNNEAFLMFSGHQIIHFVASATVGILLSVAATAGPYDPPPTYYNSATGTGTTLKSQLHNIIDNHTVRSYGDARLSLQVTDQDPADSDRMILVYDRDSIDVSAINPNGSVPGWDNAATWNREHTWPRSRGVDSSGPDNSDLHQLRPSRTQINSDRGNLNFGGAFGVQGFGTVFDKGSLVWYPGDADAGMIARQQFYMAVRYDNSDSATDDLELVNGAPNIGGTTMGDLARLIEWHYEAPPDDFELRRNDVIYDSYQFNRNPFIDRPEYVWSIFVDQQNDSQVSISGATIDANGGSTAQVDLGRVLVGAATPAAQAVTLNKNGSDGTYIEASTTGDATSSLGGRHNAFRTGGSDSATFEVGLNTSTASAGVRSGTVTFNNLDVTTAGGAGQGANDGDDEVNVSLDVLDHASPSFSSSLVDHMLTIDFGTVEQNLSTSLGFDLYNLESTAGFTAGLDLDNISAVGDSTILTTDLSTFAGAATLLAGASNNFVAEFDTSQLGSFSATYTLSFSDEDLPGSQLLDDLTLVLLGSAAAPVIDNPDFDGDGFVDGNDFLIWQRGFGTGTMLSEGDANHDGLVNEEDLAVWEQHYGQQSIGSIATIPEPTSGMMFGLFVARIVANRRRQ
ncbi:MAG: endonuclease [Bythopirellula sp.]